MTDDSTRAPDGATTLTTKDDATEAKAPTAFETALKDYTNIEAAREFWAGNDPSDKALGATAVGAFHAGWSAILEARAGAQMAVMEADAEAVAEVVAKLKFLHAQDDIEDNCPADLWEMIRCVVADLERLTKRTPLQELMDANPPKVVFASSFVPCDNPMDNLYLCEVSTGMCERECGVFRDLLTAAAYAAALSYKTGYPVHPYGAAVEYLENALQSPLVRKKMASTWEHPKDAARAEGGAK
ncbi:MAG TPA: hypothetical protein VN034_06550 [Sphingopyxis sp.]|nr:hypothetical protein [Sphingopyxis sp.]